VGAGPPTGLLNEVPPLGGGTPLLNEVPPLGGGTPLLNEVPPLGGGTPGGSPTASAKKTFQELKEAVRMGCL